jgi:transcriptional regulator with XRE-family HTH domain
MCKLTLLYKKQYFFYYTNINLQNRFGEEMKFGDILKELLDLHNMTQKNFAQILGITPAALGNYIHNTREPDFNILLKISDYFHVSIDFLLNNTTSSSLSHSEEVLLNIFRSLTPDQKEFYIEQGKIFIRQNNRNQI